ncbi:MAG: 2'-hydroxyisoflavone reductase [Myxococcota bacterium]
MSRVLVFGGTGFLSAEVVDAALRRGWEVTAVHRGRRGVGAPGATHLIADRDAAPDLPGGPWHAVIDCSAQRGAQVQHAVQALAGRVDRYVLVSTCSVYAEHLPDGNHEASSVVPPVEVEAGEMRDYPGRKVACERALDGWADAVRVRSGLLVGPRDPTERFSWWVRRLARGGQVLAPGVPEGAAQVLDVRDLAEWLCHLAMARHRGVVNAVGRPTTLGALLEAVPRPAGTHLTWVPDAILTHHGLSPWSDVPLWLSEPLWGFARAHGERCTAWGLRIRPLADTVADTASWCASHPPACEPGPTPAVEQAVLADQQAQRTENGQASRSSGGV